MHLVRRADAVQEGAVLRATAQKYVLTVVEAEPLAIEGPRETPEVVALFDEHDLRARVGRAERGGDAGETAADHRDAGVRRARGRAHERAPMRRARGVAMPPAETKQLSATQSFSDAGTETRPRVTATGSDEIRCRSRW